MTTIETTNGTHAGRPRLSDAEKEAARLERERMKDPAYVADLLDKASAEVRRLTKEAARAHTEALDAKRTALEKLRTSQSKKDALTAARTEETRLQAALWEAEEGSVE